MSIKPSQSKNNNKDFSSLPALVDAAFLTCCSATCVCVCVCVCVCACVCVCVCVCVSE